MAWTDLDEARTTSDSTANHTSDHNQMAELANDLARTKFPLTRKASADDPPDDEFDDTTGMSGSSNGLDAKWTAVSGSSGTVNLFETSDVSEYDLATRPGWILLQAGSNGSQRVSLRQDWTIASGESIVVAFSKGLTVDGATGYADNQHDFLVSVNNNDTSHTSGSYVYLSAQTYHEGSRWSAYNGTTEYATDAYTGATAGSGTNGGLAYIRLHFDGTLVWPMWSIDGTAWVMMGPGYALTTMNNLWIVSDNGASHGDPAPIDGVYFVRQGDSGVDPW